MNRLKLFGFGLIVTVFYASPALAIDNVWSPKMKITRIEAPSANSVITQFTTDVGTQGCAEEYFSLSDTTQNYKEIYAMLLTAATSGKQIESWLAPCANGVRPVVHVRLYP